MSLLSCIKRNKMAVFRRMYIRRRLQSGEYETDWQRIPNKYIKKWGTISFSLEDEKPNFYKYSGAQISVINNDGFFSDESQRASFFYGYLGLHRTMIKIEAGYIDTDATEYPTSPVLFIGLIDIGATQYKYDNEIQFKANHISQIFEETYSDRVVGLGVTQTASDVIGKIRDYVDAGSNAVFQKFISATAWNITTTSNNYNMATSTNLSGMSCWQLMQKMAESENYVMYIDNNASFYFKENTGVPASVTFHFAGIGDDDRTWGHTIMKTINIDPGYNKVYNRIKVQFGADETTSSYYIRNESWTWGDSSSSFRFGVREYKYENEWLSAALITSTAIALFNEFSEPKKRVTFDAKFVPQMMLMQRVSLTYKTNRYQSPDLWGLFHWNEGIWGKTLAYNINIDNEEMKVVDLKHDLDTFKSTVKVKQI